MGGGVWIGGQRKRPKLARVGGGGATRVPISSRRSGGGSSSSKEPTAREIWRRRLGDKTLERKHDKVYDDEDEMFDDEEGGGGNASGIDDDDDDSSSGTESSESDEDGVWQRSEAIRRAQQAVSNREGKLVTATQAAGLLEYEEVRHSFYMDDSTGLRRVVSFDQDEQMPDDVATLDYRTLHAFNSGSARGWGVCCTQPIRSRQVVSEVSGRYLSEAQFAALTDRRYVFGFDDEMLGRKRATDDTERYLDLREYGNMMRLVNDEEEEPNLEALYWPLVEDNSSRLPRRIFLIARHSIPPLTELTWNYGDTYSRTWRVDEDCASEKTDDDIEWTEINWAQCDACNKWRKLPCGPEYCPEALPSVWYCSLNASTHANTCDEPEDEMEQGEVYKDDDPAAPSRSPFDADQMTSSDEEGGSSEEVMMSKDDFEYEGPEGKASKGKAASKSSKSKSSKSKSSKSKAATKGKASKGDGSSKAASDGDGNGNGNGSGKASGTGTKKAGSKVEAAKQSALMQPSASPTPPATSPTPLAVIPATSAPLTGKSWAEKLKEQQQAQQQSSPLHTAPHAAPPAAAPTAPEAPPAGPPLAPPLSAGSWADKFKKKSEAV
eukprot:CAMPEP_0174698448 /NCGR_PEP_ID=MMETSP1094-20130205/4049_1 /TAXON_ID=156173 /ORGANISM="Chrysochromulina brevifilum, Strain UTEX LB 985" /LENGTH=605 /DNA_ID=CAMNT_0015895637 /DNA_START=18 /DNA_END=1835 /DNA_ORIENTATION=+